MCYYVFVANLEDKNMIIDIGEDDNMWVVIVKIRMIHLNKKQKDLADKLKVSENTISKWFSNPSVVALKSIRNIENALMQWELEYAEVKS